MKYQEIKNKYNELFEEVLSEEKAKGRGNVVIINTVWEDGKQVDTNFHEPEFFLCGFNTLYLTKAKENKKLLTSLKKEVVKIDRTYEWYGRSVWVGYKLDVAPRGQGNGYFTIQTEAMRRLCRYLKDLGYDADVKSKID
jgi:hypothetical protein